MHRWFGGLVPRSPRGSRIIAAMSEDVPTEPQADPLLGKVFDERYRIEEQLGEGGIGRVYRARHLTLGRMVALKVLLTKYESIPVLQQRFQREAEALAALSHPNIVTVTDFGVADGNPYIVMELLEGRDLATVIEGEPLEPARVWEIMRQMLRALAYAHERELVHRDLKPQNVFVRALGDGTDHVEVLDFGLARFMGDAAKNSPKLTRQGALLGTPAYMAPEQASGEEVDARADVYAAGCVFFETLTGRRVFHSKDPGEVLRSHLLAAPPRIAHVDTGLEVDERLEQVVQRSLSKSPSARYAGAKEMLAALDELGPDSVRRIGARPDHDVAQVGVAPTQMAGIGPRPSDTGATRAATPAAKHTGQPGQSGPLGRTGGTSIVIPQNKLPLVLGAGVIALLLASVGGWLVYHLFTSSDDRTPVAVPTPPSSLDAGGLSALDAGPPVAARPEPRDPFAGELPAAIADIHRREPSARRLNQVGFRRYLASINEYQRGNPQDPLPHLVMGHVYTDKRWLSFALPAYREAVDLDLSVRGDPHMLPDLLEMVRTDALERDAASFVAEIYGAEALPAVDEAIGTRGIRRNEREHLEALRERIAPSD